MRSRYFEGQRVLSSNDLEYFRKRAIEARRFAEVAQDSSTQSIHRQIAEEYDARLQAIEACNISEARPQTA